MCDSKVFVPSVTLRRVALKDLEPDMDSILVVGIIIAKQKPRKFADKTNEVEALRAVWNFTIRDSERDFINVTYWGKSEHVFTAYDKFYTGDVVQINRPRINIRKFNDIGEQFRPIVTSPYSLSLNEISEILPYEGDTFFFTKLLKLPTKPVEGFVPLRDIHNEGAKMKDRFVDILGAVRSVGTIRNVNTKNGQETQLREVILFDHTSAGLKVTIWDVDVMTRANNWKQRSTILFITDCRVEWSNFLRSYSASLTNRSVVTENPIAREAASLALYAKNAPLETSAILDRLITSLPDPESIQNVMCVQQVWDHVNSFAKDNCNVDQKFTALLYVFVSKLDLDGTLPCISVRCNNCKSWVKTSPWSCENRDCSSFGALNSSEQDFDVALDIKIDLSDHTGTLTNCRLSRTTAEQVLECTVQEFQRMTDAQKSILKWKFLLERCAVRIMIMLLNRRTPLISIVSCTKAEPIDAAQRMPAY